MALVTLIFLVIPGIVGLCLLRALLGFIITIIAAAFIDAEERKRRAEPWWERSAREREEKLGKKWW